MLKPTNTMPERRTGTQPLTSLTKGLQLLVFLRDSTKPLSLTAISRGLGFHKVSVLRIFLTLERHLFFEKIPAIRHTRSAATLSTSAAASSPGASGKNS